MSASTAWDRCGAPLLRLDAGKLVHALPVTVYHIERYLWTVDDAGLDLETVLPADRPRPPFADLRHLNDLWAQRLTVDQAAKVASWLGGRLTTRVEWFAAHKLWDDGRSIAASWRVSGEGDGRLGELVRALASRRVRRRSDLVEPNFGEFASEFSHGGLGTVSIMSMRSTDGVVVQSHHGAYRADGVGFCCVFDVTSDGVRGRGEA
jgi:hypothetical protein